MTEESLLSQIQVIFVLVSASVQNQQRFLPPCLHGDRATLSLLQKQLSCLSPRTLPMKSPPLFLTMTPHGNNRIDESVGHTDQRKAGLPAGCIRIRRKHIYGSVARITMENENLFAERLTTAREARKLSQTELAKLSGLQPAAIGHFEHSRRKPSFANIRALAKALNVTADYLLGRAPNMEGATTVFRGEENLTNSDREHIQMMIDLMNKRKSDNG